MDVLPGMVPCPRLCAGSVDPLTLPAHLAWHDAQDARILALETRLLSLGIRM
jgi:hypothetical protein